MCGRLNVTDSPALGALCEQLEISLWHGAPIYKRFIRATDQVSLVRQHHGIRRMDNAIWWLLLEPTASGFSPSRYTSFNTRYDKLNVPGSAGYKAFRQSRCVIPVSGFGETEFAGKKPLHYHDLYAEDGAMLLGGLYREWHHPASGNTLMSCSVITLPPHPKLADVHTKAMPLILPKQPALISHWLDESQQDVTQFTPLLAPNLPQTLIAQPIDKPSLHQCAGEAFVIDAD